MAAYDSKPKWENNLTQVTTKKSAKKLNSD